MSTSAIVPAARSSDQVPLDANDESPSDVGFDRSVTPQSLAAVSDAAAAPPALSWATTLPAVFRAAPTRPCTIPHHVIETLVLNQSLPAGQPDTLGGRNGC